MNAEYLNQLNEQQAAAVSYLDGPSLVIAGAGSGKTRTLTYKIVHLLNQGIEPHRIMALTFTNKAAREMRERIEQLVGPYLASRLWMGTFHSIFSRLIRSNADRIGFKSSFTIYDASDSRSLVKQIIKQMGLDDKIYKPASVLSSISTAKNALVSPERYATLPDLMRADADARRPETHAIYRAYRDRCFHAGAMDFDDLLYYMNVLLRDNADILHHYQEFFRYVLVDEYQDTNFAQHVIVSQLCSEHHNLCVVGDDAQSIYSFRGANIRNILNLKKAYPELRTFKLEQNYRSTQNIVGAANSLIKHNQMQIPKNVVSMGAPGSRIEVVSSYSDFEESFLVANRLAHIHTRSGDSYQEYAILYRTNAQSRILEESLRKRNIPYRIYGGLSFYQRKEVRDAIAYFRVCVNPDDDEALRRIINYPARGIGETTLNKLTQAAADAGVSIWTVLSSPGLFDTGLKTAPLRKLSDFKTLMEGFIDMNRRGDDAYQLAHAIIDKTRMIADLISDRTPESISRRENLEELVSGVKQFVDTAREEGRETAGLGDFLQEISLATDQDSDDSAGEERVTLMTIHASKGLEFRNVFIVGVEEDLLPSSMAQGSAAEIEEERRLLYVAMTRAKEFCMLSYATSRFRNGQTTFTRPSRFLGEIDPRYLKLMSGASISVSAAPRVNPAERYRDSFHSPVSPVAVRPHVSNHPLTFGGGGKPAATTVKPAPVVGAALHQAHELSEGMEIEHTMFGVGTIIAIDLSQADPRIKVEFDNMGEKNLLLKFAKFRIVE
ncbi:MAG: UvrD-helicase domain-containing protein [Muribaculaceae bacterium]|nr:UvrD-helicase domain-containing protein [Muribaculaceae bacterium]